MDELEMEQHQDEEEEAPLFPIRDAVLGEMLSTSALAAKLQPGSLQLASVLVRGFIMEAWHRAAAEAERSCAAEVDETHLEKIMPQLLLDFGP